MNPRYLHVLLIILWTIYLIWLYHQYFGFTNNPLLKLAPRQTDLKFSIAVFGDCQGADNPFTSLRPTYFVFNNLLDSINSRPPLATIILGDMVVSGRAYHYYRFRRQLDRLRTPVFPVIGNHDVKYNGRSIFTKVFGSAYYARAIGSNIFFFLDNATGSIAAQQLTWLETQLETNRHSHFYVFLHQPLFDPRPGQHYAMSDQAQAQKLKELFSRYQVKAVFASHLHGYYSAVQDGVAYFITGGGGSTLTSSQDYYHYLLLHINQDQFNVEIIKVPAAPAWPLLWRWCLLFIPLALLLFFTFSAVR